MNLFRLLFLHFKSTDLVFYMYIHIYIAKIMMRFPTSLDYKITSYRKTAFKLTIFPENEPC